MPKGPSRSRLFRWTLLAATAGACALAGLPTTIRQGINHEVRPVRIPLGVKAVEFLLRDYHYRRLSSELTAGLSAPEARAAALFEWTHRQIRRTPPDWPIVDDHIANIIIRGYGEDDQMADVFTTLTTYAGAPAFWKELGSDSDEHRLILSFVHLQGRWTVWDVEAGVVLRDRAGRLVGVGELDKDPEVLELAVRQAPARGPLYTRFIPGEVFPLEVPETLRAEKQMGLRRIGFEIRRLLQ